MNKRKNVLDELQEQKLLQLEHNMAWLAFWGLLAAMIVQMFFGIEDMLENIIGEWVIFMSLCVYMLIACLKNGIWSRFEQPSPKSNLRVCLIAGVACALIVGLAVYFAFKKPMGALIGAGIAFVVTAVLTYILLSIASRAYKKKLNELESEDENGENEK